MVWRYAGHVWIHIHHLVRLCTCSALSRLGTILLGTGCTRADLCLSGSDLHHNLCIPYFVQMSIFVCSVARLCMLLPLSTRVGPYGVDSALLCTGRTRNFPCWTREFQPRTAWGLRLPSFVSCRNSARPDTVGTWSCLLQVGNIRRGTGWGCSCPGRDTACLVDTSISCCCCMSTPRDTAPGFHPRNDTCRPARLWRWTRLVACRLHPWCWCLTTGSTPGSSPGAAPWERKPLHLYLQHSPQIQEWKSRSTHTTYHLSW